MAVATKRKLTPDPDEVVSEEGYEGSLQAKQDELTINRTVPMEEAERAAARARRAAAGLN